jgi:hypothetical protein
MDYRSWKFQCISSNLEPEVMPRMRRNGLNLRSNCNEIKIYLPFPPSRLCCWVQLCARFVWCSSAAIYLGTVNVPSFSWGLSPSSRFCWLILYARFMIHDLRRIEELKGMSILFFKRSGVEFLEPVRKLVWFLRGLDLDLAWFVFLRYLSFLIQTAIYCL